MNNFLWLVRREFWENRGGFLWAPFFTAIVYLVLNLLGLISAEVFRSRAHINISGMDLEMFAENMDAKAQQAAGMMLDSTLLGPGFLIGIVLFVVVFFYCLNSLAEDRRDRSILFWKSLPVSERDTVLSKVASATVVAPVIATIISLVCGVLQFLLVSVFAAFHGVNLFGALFQYGHPFRVLATTIAILPVGLVWALPTVGWLMLCSAGAKSKPFLWALSLPFGAGILVLWSDFMNLFGLEGGWFWQHIVARSLLSVVPGSWMASGIMETFSNGHDDENLRQTLDQLLSLSYNYSQLFTMEFLLGAVAGAIMIAGAIWFRRWRTEY